MSNTQENESAEYTLLHSVDEERGLLQSVSDQQLVRDDLSRASSVCDQPIELSSSNLDEVKLYKEIPNTSQVPTKADQLKMKKKVSYLEEQEPSKELFDQVKEYANKFVDIFRWKRQYESFGQLYFQVAFDGLAIYYLNKKIKGLNQQRQQSVQDEKLIRECISTLATSPASFYMKAKQDQKVVYRGNTFNPLAISHVNNKINDKKYSKELNAVFQLQCQKGNTINAQFDPEFTYKKTSSIVNSENKMNLMSSVGATFISIFTGSFFRTKINFEEGFKTGQNYYFFGKKILLGDGDTGLKITQIFKEFDLERFRTDQAAYLLSILVASGVGIYVAVKLVKNLLYLSKKKKLFK